MYIMFTTGSLVILLSTSLSLILIYLNAPLSLLYQIAVVLIALLIVLSSRFIFNHTSSRSLTIRSLLIFLITFFVQVLVVATGGFFSPLFIILHLSILGFGLFLGFALALVLLACSLTVILGNIALNQELYALFASDVSSAAIYTISLLAIIPLTKYLVDHYRIKDTLASVLNLTSNTEKSILGSLTEQVFITDQNLNILFSSAAVLKFLKLPNQNILGQNLLAVLDLKDSNKAAATKESLQITSAIADKSPKIIDNLYLHNLKNYGDIKMTIQINPVADVHNKIQQLVIVLNPGSSETKFLDLLQAQTRNSSRADQVKKTLKKNNLPHHALLVDLLMKTEQDLVRYLELEDHSFKYVESAVDIKMLCQAAVTSDAVFSSLFSLQVYFDNQITDTKSLNVSTDPKWFGVLLQKLIDLGIILSSTKGNTVVLSLKQSRMGQLYIEITARTISLTSENIKELFLKYNGPHSPKVIMNVGSGLEGFIASTITRRLRIPFDSEYDSNLSVLTFRIRLN